MNIWVLPSLVAVAILAGLTCYVIIREPPAPLGPSTTATLLSVLLFAIGDTATYFSSAPDSLWLATSISYTGIMLVAPSSWMLAHRFAEACGHPTPWSHTNWVYLPIFVIVPLWLAMITNPLHGQFVSVTPNTRNDYHWMWHLHTYVSYLCAAASCLIYATLSVRVKSKVQRRRIIIMLMAPFVTIAANLAYLTSPVVLPFDPTPASFAGTGILFFIGIYRVGLFSLNPVAMSSIIDHQPNGIVVTDMDGTLIHWNQAANQSLRASLHIDQEYFDAWLSTQLKHEQDDRCLTTNELKEKIENLEIGAPIPQFSLFHHQNLWVKIRVDNILSRKDRKVARSYFIRDTSQSVQQENERLGLERKMFQSQKLEGIGLLAGGIAHDFNNLLMAIRGNAELISAETNLDSKARERLSVIVTVSDRAARLTKKLLMYSGDAPALKTPLDLSQLVRETSELIRTALLPKQLSLSLQLADDCWVEGDQPQLEQVLLNLAINAAEAYAGNSGTVTIQTRTTNSSEASLGHCLHSTHNLDADFVMLQVQDEGCGMSSATVDRIVDPFFSSKGYGRGLGLSAVMGIVRSHNGAVYVQSEVDRGARFCVLLPRQHAVQNAPLKIETEATVG